MSKELSVYNQMKQGVPQCLAVLKREIGLKTTCTPFAIKLMSALQTLQLKTQEQEIAAANTLLSGLQTLSQGGINAEDYDKIDFVKRGFAIVPSARVEAFLRAAARKGYRITDTIVAVPQEDKGTTYFKENFYNGDVVYILEDARKNPDRDITPERVINGYFAKYICRLDVHDVKKNARIAMTVSEIPNDELLAIASASEQGLFKSEWISVQTPYGPKRKKVITKEMNDPTAFWIKWCSEMTKKSIIRRALKRIKEVLPELTDTIYTLETKYVEEQPEDVKEPAYIECPIETADVDLANFTPEQMQDAYEMLKLFKANPKLAENKTAEIRDMFEVAKMDVQDVINREYATIAALARSKRKWEEIGGYFEDAIG